MFHRKSSRNYFHRHTQHGFKLYDRAMNGEKVTSATLPIISQDLRDRRRPLRCDAHKNSALWMRLKNK